jgi:hypothetical protein
LPYSQTASWHEYCEQQARNFFIENQQEIHYNNIMITKMIIEFLKKKTIKGLERNHRFLELLKRLEITELKPTFDSVYTHALVKYSNETIPGELVKLFALKAVKKAFEEEFYNDPGKEGVLVATEGFNLMRNWLF